MEKSQLGAAKYDEELCELLAHADDGNRVIHIRGDSHTGCCISAD